MKIQQKLALVCCVAALAAAPAFFIAAHAADNSTQADSSAKPKKRTVKVDINSASSAELQTLKGIDEAAADKIIQNRPYASITQLVSKAGLTKAAYNDIKDEVDAKKPADNSSSKSNKNKGNNTNKNKGNTNKGKRR